jgi:hypothetical protein
MPSRMREEKVELRSPQEVKKRMLWIGLQVSVQSPRAGLEMHARLYHSSSSWVELASSTGGSVGLNTFCYLNLFLVFSSVCGTAARVMHGVLFVYCRSFFVRHFGLQRKTHLEDECGVQLIWLKYILFESLLHTQ